MKILVVSSWCPVPADNGSRLRAFHLMAQLAARGHRLSLVALGQPETDLEAAQADLAPFCPGGVRLFASRFFQPDTLRARLGYLSPRPRMLLDTFQPQAAAAIAAECRSGGHDLVLALELGVAHYIPAGTPIPCVLDQVEVSALARSAAPRTRGGRLRLAFRLAKLRGHLASLAPRFAFWTVVSEPEREAVLRLLGRSAPPLHVLSNGVDLQVNDCPPHVPYDADLLIYNGALGYEANRDAVTFFVAEILPRIQSARPRARLLVTGRADRLTPEDPLRRHPDVTLSGFLPDLRPAVRGAAVCVVPLRQGGGTRLKILEAMALGTPVVATGCGAEGLAVEDGVHLLLADGAPAFADATLRLMDDPCLRGRLRADGRRLVETRYGWSEIGGRLESALQALIAAGTTAVKGRP